MVKVYSQEIKDWDQRLKKGELHMVCVASGGLTACDCAACTVGNLDRDNEVWPFTIKVNENGETGSFYPKLNLTVVPILEWDNRNYPKNPSLFIENSFYDVLLANKNYIKSNTLLVDLNGYGVQYPYKEARIIAEKVLTTDPNITEIYFTPEM